LYRKTRVSLGAAAVCVTALLASSANAASISYFLNQSNALADGPNYLKVTVADDGLAAPNTIYFTVEILDPLLSLAGTNFGIQRFAFNSTIDVMEVAYKIGNLPSGWEVRVGDTVSGFGVFELIPTGSGMTRQSPTLTFTIDSSSYAADSIFDYIVHATCPSGGSLDDPLPMTCIPAQGASFFAAHVAGFSYPGGITRAYFGVDFPDKAQVVPIPAAAWLFVSSLGLLGWMRPRTA
jgi:hypothetical protein